MQCRRIIGERHRYWNIKGCGCSARFFATNRLSARGKARGDFCWKCGTNVPQRVGQRIQDTSTP